MTVRIMAVLLALLAAGGPARADVRVDAGARVDSLTKTVIANVVDSKASIDAKNAELKKVFLQYGDMPYVSRFVLGKAWKSAGADMQARFSDAFVDALSKTWVRRFTEFSGKGSGYSFKNVKTEENPDTKDVFVTTSVVPENGGQPNVVVWRFRDSGKGLKMTDIAVEGVSMAMTYRNEFASILAGNGGDVAGLVESIKNGRAGAAEAK